MDLEDLIGPLPAPLGRWMLRRMVASGVRYGHEFVVLLVRGAEPDALVDAGGYAGARDRGTLRLEGRDYAMRDGDVITVKFTP